MTADLLQTRINEQTELLLAVAVTLVGILAIRGFLHWFGERERAYRLRRAREREAREEEEPRP